MRKIAWLIYTTFLLASIPISAEIYKWSLRKFDVASDDPLECVKEFSKDPKCKAWAFGKKIPIERPLSICWLKAFIPEKKKKETTISGVKID